jgi:hypothetical protein
MPRNEFLSESSQSASRLVRGGTGGGESLWAVNQRLCIAERELRVQFTRIAQLQAQLDLVWGAPTFAGWSSRAMRVSAEKRHP